jgi:hypothetical protein
MTGIALGPLLGGVLAQYTALPLRIPLIVYLVELALVAAIVIVVARRPAPATAMRTGLVVLIPAVALVVIAQGLRSLPLLLVASAVCGAALALGYRGGLQVVNDIAGDERRGQVTAGYMICFCALTRIRRRRATWAPAGSRAPRAPA